MTLHDWIPDAALREPLTAIASACAEIARAIRTAGLGDIYGAAGATNVQGEQQQKLDIFANDTLIARLAKLPSVAAIVSEEDDAPIAFPDHTNAKFVIIFDPLDGSSNIDVNVNVGTIVSIQRTTGDATTTALQTGNAQAAALYVVYGPSTILVLTVGSGVASFVLNDHNQFQLAADNMRMPAQGPYYSTNEARAADWPQPYRDFLALLLSDKLNGQTYGARYIGSLVADFHRTLLKGGIFLYPPTAKTPNGKLRLLYEANPLAMIAEQSGGAATNGPTRILNLQPTNIHQRTPLVIGSRAEVEALQKLTT
jgi:fructose-1,6-bisphosphatase I